MRILRLPNVLDRTGLSRSTVYQRVSEGRFPKPVSLGARAVGWVETDIEEWICRQIGSSRNILSEEAIGRKRIDVGTLQMGTLSSVAPLVRRRETRNQMGHDPASDRR